jgi:alpha-tubulin suppressor-like RCC1 family protein
MSYPRSVVALASLVAACGARSSLDVGGTTGAPDAGVDAGPESRVCFTELAARGTAVCALRWDGVLYCWGNNVAGQLALPMTAENLRPPTLVSALDGVEAISMGGEFGCARTRDGLFCFGRDNFGQVGNGPDTAPGAPAQVEGLSAKPIAVSAGGTHACAIDDHANLHCWGNNGWGQLGLGFHSDPSDPGVDRAEHVVALENVTAVAAGEVHTCAVVGGTAIYCWGGRASEPSYPSPGPPAPVFIAESPVPILEIEAGEEFACGIDGDGVLRCWGKNAWAVLGDGTTEDHATPATVVGVDGRIVDVAGSFNHACAAAEDGDVFCWGTNQGGALGRDSSVGANPDPFPRSVAGIGGRAVEVAVGYGFSCALTSDGAVWCWGNQDFAQLGVVLDAPEDHPAPRRVDLPCP